METNRRWIDRHAYFHRACERLATLTRREMPAEKLNIYGEAAIVKFFEIAFELAWRTLEDYLRFHNCEKPQGPEQVIQLALENGIISQHGQWHDMLRDSDQKNYLYNHAGMHEVAQRIYNNYIFTLNALDARLQEAVGEL